MMKKKFYFLPLFLLALAFVSCDETEEEPGEYENWRERNEMFADSLAAVYDANPNGDLKRLVNSRDQRQYIYYKVLEDGDPSLGRPKYNSIADAYYRGMYINEGVFGSSNEPNYTKLWEKLYVFDSNFRGNDPDPEFDTTMTFQVDRMVPGWIEALQHMNPGSRWELYIPYESAYGTEDRRDDVGNVIVPGYTALIFDVTLVSYVE